VTSLLFGSGLPFLALVFLISSSVQAFGEFLHGESEISHKPVSLKAQPLSFGKNGT